MLLVFNCPSPQCSIIAINCLPHMFELSVCRVRRASAGLVERWANRFTDGMHALLASAGWRVISD